ncbi:MAG: MtrB/PioB family outer membrane beta-barrel protein [Thermodesulfobacteriota bacterium]
MNNDTDVNTLSASASWQANERLTLNLGLAYSMAEMEMEDVRFDSEQPLGSSVPLSDYDPANTNNMESYSDLEYDVWDINLGASYAINDSIGLNLHYVYSDTDDEEAYVYGDEDGTYQSLITYLTFRF